jgi:hypothetical protein
MLKEDIRAVLCAMGDDLDAPDAPDAPDVRATLDYGFIVRFVPIADAAYDDIRAMVAAAEAANYLTLR